MFRTLQLIFDWGNYTAAAPTSAAVVQDSPKRVRRTRERSGDDMAVDHLTERHAYYNLRFFEGKLRTIPVKVSRRLRRRLGYYRLINPGVEPVIMISHRHIRRHGWDEAYDTLMHEMVHQWQNETGRVVDHGREFRQKAREIGILPRACRKFL